MNKAMVMALFCFAFSAGSFSASADVAASSDLQPMITGGPFTWVSYASILYPPSRCVTATDGGQVTLSGCDGGMYQSWNHTQNQAGDEIRNVQTGLCLEGGSPSSPSVTVQPCNGGNAQRWVLTQNTQGWSMRNASSGYCLDTNGSIALQNYCGLGDPSRQRWVKQ